MRTTGAVLLMALAGCEQEPTRRASPSPTPGYAPVPTPLPAPPPRPTTPPAPPAPPTRAAPATPPINASIAVYTRDESPVAECQRKTLLVRLIDKTKRTSGKTKHVVLDKLEETSECEQACTPEEKAEGAAALESIERGIANGTASPSQTDYNFTGCLPAGYGDHLLFREVGGRDVVIYTTRYQGPHDWGDHSLRLITEICGKLFVTGEIGHAMGASWPLETIRVTAEGRDALLVSGKNRHDKRVELFRLELPACPDPPREIDHDVDPRVL